MPTISERQLLIEAILLAGEEDTDQCHRAEPTAIDQSGEEGGPSLLPSRRMIRIILRIIRIISSSG
jgi:hypothetical protein